MKDDIYTITINEHQLELLAIAYQTAVHRAMDNEIMARIGDLAFVHTFFNENSNFKQDYEDLQTKVVKPIEKQYESLIMGEQYI